MLVFSLRKMMLNTPHPTILTG